MVDGYGERQNREQTLMDIAVAQTHVRVLAHIRSCCSVPWMHVRVSSHVNGNQPNALPTPDLKYGVQAIIAKQAAAQKKAPKEVSESRGLLRVTVVEAENLPKLDLMRASGMKSLHLLLYYSSVLAKLNNASFMWGI
jgi:hypothetical protein